MSNKIPIYLARVSNNAANLGIAELQSIAIHFHSLNGLLVLAWPALLVA
jgi:hypothetical protein